MTIITRALGSFENESVIFELDYDDATMLVAALRCINGTRKDANCDVRAGDGTRHTKRCGSEKEDVLTIPTVGNTKIVIARDERGGRDRLLGLDGVFMWPVG